MFSYSGQQQYSPFETWVPLASLSVTVYCLPQGSIKPRVRQSAREKDNDTVIPVYMCLMLRTFRCG